MTLLVIYTLSMLVVGFTVAGILIGSAHSTMNTMSLREVWAMAACAGILFTELLGKDKWFEAGAGEYWLPNNALIALEALIMGFFELKRYQGWKTAKCSGVLNAFPFDPADINCLFLTHSHLDHIGLVPRLVRRARWRGDPAAV